MANALSPVVVDVVRRLNGTRRFVGLGIIAAALALLWVGSRWAAAPTYVTLYHDLDLGAAGSVTESLSKNGIQYRLEEGGTAVLVGSADVARARVLLAKDGLPGTGRPGLELFDKPSWGMTDFTQRITYRRALEGELSRTIGTLRGVERAQVHLALPESSPLRKLERPAEAAVVLKLRPGVVLGSEVVQGIAYIVSNSVEQLASENVAVMDDSGRLLSVPADDRGSFGLSSRQIELQRSVERQLSERVESLLGTVLGPGAARVQVSALLNFEQVDRTIESFDPDGGVLSTEQRSETEAQPDLGTGAETIVNNAYQNSRRVERIVGAVGTINRLTVAVLLDQQKLGAASLEGLELAVRNAIGIDSTRGDRVTLTAMPFEVSAAAAIESLEPDSTSGGQDVLVVVERFTRPGIMVLGIIAALILGLRLLKPLPAPALAAPAAAAAVAPAAAGMALGEPPTAPQQQLRSRVVAQVTESPNTTAQVIRAWMAES